MFKDVEDVRFLVDRAKSAREGIFNQNNVFDVARLLFEASTHTDTGWLKDAVAEILPDMPEGAGEPIVPGSALEHMANCPDPMAVIRDMVRGS